MKIPLSTDNIRRPRIRMLDTTAVERVIEEARQVLERIGVRVENTEALEVLGSSGARIDGATQTVRIPPRLVEQSLKTAPAAITLYDRNGRPAMHLAGDNSYFNPLLCATEIWDARQSVFRMPLTSDAIDHVRLVDSLLYIDGQYPFGGTELPVETWDCHKLYLALKYSCKPVHASIGLRENFSVFRQMLLAVRDGEKDLRAKPILSLPVCPSPPLKFSDLVCHAIMEGARCGIPLVLQPIPQPGLTAPMNISGAVVQSIAEDFAALVLSQLVCPGAPIVLGITAMTYDMRWGTVLGGAIETAMINMAHVDVVKHLGKPSMVFMGADAKRPDVQAGLEAGIGTVLATLTGANLISGAGVLNNVNAQSLEMLVVDNEIRGMARRLAEGVNTGGVSLAEDLFRDGLYEGEHFLLSPATLECTQSEYFWPGRVINRLNREAWLTRGASSAENRARAEVRRILKEHRPEPLPEAAGDELESIMTEAVRRYGMPQLPPEKLPIPD